MTLYALEFLFFTLITMQPAPPPKYSVIKTDVLPSYSCIVAENNYLRHAVEYRDAIAHQLQTKVDALTKSVDELEHDAKRWRRFKEIIDSQKGEMSAEQLQRIVDTGR